MKKSLVVFGAILLLLIACRPRTSESLRSGGPQEVQQRTHAAAEFDFYLLNLSWSPEFCHSHPTAVECSMHARFVLHGLWPQNADGTHPQNCSNAPGPANPSKYRDVYPDPGLLQHEWRTHGTCSGLGPDAYFSAARKAFQAVTIPAELAGLNSQTSLPPGQIMALFSRSNPQIPLSAMAVSCGNNYLTAFEVCLDKTLQPMACSEVRSCRANTVKIVPP